MRLSGQLSTPLAGVDDPVACLLHLAGAGFFAWQALRLVRRAGEARRRAAALAVFAGASVGALGISAAYHVLSAGHAWKPLLQRADHSAIFLLIAGTLTAFHAVGFHGRGRWWMVGLVWTIALSAMAVKIVWWATLGDGVGLALYVGLSALGLSSLLFLPRKLPLRAFAPMGIGGAVYVSGALGDHFAVGALFPAVFGPHELFHVAVLTALLVHWQFFHEWALPGRATAPAPARASAALGAAQ